jgi:hypothetical protein
MTGAELKSIREAFGPSAFVMGKAFGCSSPKASIIARIRPLAVCLALILVAIGLPHSPALADDASALIGRWVVPSREQEKLRMSPQCQRYAETDVQMVPESEIEIFSCDDPAFVLQKTRILEFVNLLTRSIARRIGRSIPRRSRGYARSSARPRRNGRPIFAIRAKSCAGLQSKICRSSGISGHQTTPNGRSRVIATLPRRGTGRSPVLRGPPPVRSSRRDAADGASSCR